MIAYDPKRYHIAPWQGRFGDQRHALRVHPHIDKIEVALAEKKLEMERLRQQIRQLEVLARMANGKVIDGVLVRELNGPPDFTEWYGIGIVSAWEHRSAETYPNAHNGGATYGLRLRDRDVTGHHVENWRGSGHSKEEAVKGARAWVIRGEILPFRIDRNDGTIAIDPAKGYFR